MARHVRQRRVRRGRGSRVGIWLSALLLVCAAGLAFIWSATDPERGGFAGQDGRIEEGGKLIIGDAPAPKAPSEPTGPGRDDPRDPDEMTFYQTLTDRDTEDPAPMKLKPSRPEAGSARLPSSPSGKVEETKQPSTIPGEGRTPSLPPLGKADAQYGMSERRYTLQVGSFVDKDSAQKLVVRLRTRGYPAYLMEATLSEQDIRYRVRVGSFVDKPDARRMADRLEAKEGLKAFVAYVDKDAH